MEISIDNKETVEGEAVSRNRYISLIKAFSHNINKAYVYHNYNLNRIF